MRFRASFALVVPLAVGLALGAGDGRAQQMQMPQAPPRGGQDELCRLGVLNPLVGAWNDELSIPGAGNSPSLIVLNTGGTLVETDAIDITDPNTPHSQGYGAWTASDCRHYQVSIQKFIYDLAAKRSELVVLDGPIVLGADGTSWIATLDFKLLDAAGTVLSDETVTGVATRLRPNGAS